MDNRFKDFKTDYLNDVIRRTSSVFDRTCYFFPLSHEFSVKEFSSLVFTFPLLFVRCSYAILRKYNKRLPTLWTRDKTFRIHANIIRIRRSSLSLSLSVSIFLDHRLFVFLSPDSYRAPLRYIFAECICLIHVSQDPIPRVWQTMKASSPRFAWYCIIVANAFRLVMRISGDQEQDICAKPRGKPCLLRDLWCSLSRIAHTATINPYLVTRWWC